jgi:hypothetical protein
MAQLYQPHHVDLKAAFTAKYRARRYNPLGFRKNNTRPKPAVLKANASLQ